MSHAWFDRDGGAVRPRPHARAPWSEEMLHGRLLAGLVARTVEAEHLEQGWVPARLTIDMFRSPPMEPVATSAERIRDGGRVRVVDVSQECGGREVARARVLLLKENGRPIEPVWANEPWDLPHPDEMAHLGSASTVEDDSDAIWQFRGEPGDYMYSAGPGRGWNRDNAELVAGETVTPFVRLATSADLASPIANSQPKGLDFINADITLSIGRLPVGGWLGFETVFHRNANGVSAASCIVHDLDGPIALSTVSSVLY
ncbi:MAG: acyl-CoA thioesterase domain-containing protein [Actinomycetota bacterium]